MERLAEFAKAGINVDSLAAQLQDEGAKSFVKSWNELLAVIASKSNALKQAAHQPPVGLNPIAKPPALAQS
jgi:transaldolase